MDRLVNINDKECNDNLRMDRNAFGRFCFLMREIGGLSDSKYVSVEEQLAIFLSVLAHHKKNRVLQFDFWRSGQTLSHYVHVVLRALLKMHSILMVNPTPVEIDSTHATWKWFEGCLGAIDGINLPVHAPAKDKARFRDRNGKYTTNVLGACDQNANFVYVLHGWEGSAADSRVLRNAVNRPYGLKVPIGNYYLCDMGYANSKGFLAPYRGTRYHRDRWGPSSSRPTNYIEHFNMRHARARNVIERAVGILKKRWGILRSPCYYPIEVQIRLIMACFLMHNFIRSVTPDDPFERMLDEELVHEDEEEEEDEEDFVDMVLLRGHNFVTI